VGVGLFLSFLKGEISLYGMGIVGGAVTLLLYYYMPRGTIY
jgi:uncharacterized membrane-anchored protein